MSTFERPRQIIEYCLEPLNLEKGSAAYVEAYARLEHVIKTYQLIAVRSEARVAIDFSKMPTLTINEEAHGHV